MKVDLFDFELPQDRIATRPVTPRDAARLLVVGSESPESRVQNSGGEGQENRFAPEQNGKRDCAPRIVSREHARQLSANIKNAAVRDLPSFLQPGDVMVFNNTRVIPARLFGKRGEAKVEVTLHKRVQSSEFRVRGVGRHSEGANATEESMDPSTRTGVLAQDDKKTFLVKCAGDNAIHYLCFAKPGKKLRLGDVFEVADDFTATVEAKYESGEVLLRFDYDLATFFDKLHRYGSMPLPPYMRRDADNTDEEQYQTVYAKESGAVAAPTAGLHFTPELLAAIDASGVQRVEVTLHVGAGTFLPVKVDDTTDHQMHSEEIIVSEAQADAINTAKAKGGRIIAVGTTAMRVLESVTNETGQVQPFAGETSIFITPGYRFKAVDVLMTNFHLPRSTLFMLVSAFSGLDEMQAAYQHAIDHEYRFYSYGDACLLFKKNPESGT
jgi:S-adenosylmethionine:tRNA ribosyltransferase-isomerase